MPQRAYACLIEHSSVSDAELPVHGSSCSVNPFFRHDCCHGAHIACFSTVLTSACHHVCCCKKGQKARSSYSIMHLSSLSSSNLRRVSALRASSIEQKVTQALKSVFDSFNSSVVGKPAWCVCIITERKKQQRLWLMGGLILIDLGCAECNHWWWIFTKGSTSWLKVLAECQIVSD